MQIQLVDDESNVKVISEEESKELISNGESLQIYLWPCDCGKFILHDLPSLTTHSKNCSQESLTNEICQLQDGSPLSLITSLTYSNGGHRRCQQSGGTRQPGSPQEEGLLH